VRATQNTVTAAWPGGVNIARVPDATLLTLEADMTPDVYV